MSTIEFSDDEKALLAATMLLVQRAVDQAKKIGIETDDPDVAREKAVEFLHTSNSPIALLALGLLEQMK